MAFTVNITKGRYRNEDVSGTFLLMKPYNEVSRVLTIFNESPKSNAPSTQRIQCAPGDFVIMGDDGAEVGEHVTFETDRKSGVTAATNYEQVFISQESDEEATGRISSAFSMLDTLTDACARGIVRGLVVSGPPGVGKSFGVEKQLETANMFRKLAGQDPMYEVISGGISSIGLYQKLYYNRNKEQVLCFDDADGIFDDAESLNLQKAALNSGDKRRICWNKESRTLNVGDIPDAFDFEASVIFLTNIDFERSIAKGSKIGAHLAALMSRSHYLDLEISSMRDKLLRIKQLCTEGMLSSYMFSAQQEKDILSFIFNNSDYMREVSLRAVKKLADLVKLAPHDWYNIAEASLLTNEAKFRRLLDKKNGVVLQATE